MSARYTVGRNKKRTYSQVATAINMYKSRRERARKLYGSSSLEYNRLHSKYSSAIASMKIIRKRNEYMRWIEEQLREFIGYNVREIQPKDRKKEKLWCRWIFCKYCIENSISGYDIATFLNCHEDRPAECRRTFTRSFNTNNDNRQIWRRFKLFLKDKNEIT